MGVFGSIVCYVLGFAGCVVAVAGVAFIFFGLWAISK